MRWFLALAFALVATGAVAHPAPFSYLDLRLAAGGVQGSLVLHDFDLAHELGITPPDRLQQQDVALAQKDRITALAGQRLRLSTVDGTVLPIEWGALAVVPERQSVRLDFTLRAARPPAIAVDALLFPYDPVHQTFINVYEDDRLAHQAILDARRTNVVYYAGSAQGALAVMRVFIPSGIEHILIGPDHVLFLVGLMLLGGTLWHLATIVTAFTIGHSVTLSLAALDVLAMPSRIVEPAIALSIIFVGADNLLVTRDRTSQVRVPDPSDARDIRTWVAGAFGLVHGFGFASVLRDFGLPQTALGWSLFSFNVGVEIGQLAIVLVVAAGLAWLRRRSAAAANRLVIAGSIGVILAGGYWFMQRVFFTGGV